MKFFAKRCFLLLAVATILLPMACTEKETDLGVNLNDPFTLYSGVRDTVDFSAWTVYDDSLSASGYAAAVVGNYCVNDPNFGNVTAVAYSQIAAPKEGVRIADEVVFDSVVMTLVIDTVYPIMPDSTPRPMHVKIMQLAQPLLGDTNYYTAQPLEESNSCFFDGTVVYYADSLRLRMNENIYSVLRQTCSQADFLNIVKGVSIRLAPEDNNMLVTVDFSATNTRLTLYYHTPTAENLRFEFVMNSEAAHAMYYHHDYSGTPLASFASNRRDSIPGTQKLYLEPLGGTMVRLHMNEFVTSFHKKHPNAVIHYAELILPVSSESDTSHPVRILALKCSTKGQSTYITDANVLVNNYTYSGFDGYYNREKQQYRLRVTRHLQELLREGHDYGTDLVIDGRRSSAFRTIINGTEADKPIMIDFIYSE